jgi:hypothetical protein
MLYLIESSDYYKIGYASDIDRRLKQYNTHNPDYIVLDIKEGNTKDEALLHRKCKEFRIKGEWFEKCADVLDAWYTYEGINDEYTFGNFDELDIVLRERLLVLLRSSHNHYLSYSADLEDLIESDFIRKVPGGWLLNPYIVWKGALRDRVEVLDLWEDTKKG